MYCYVGDLYFLVSKDYDSGFSCHRTSNVQTSPSKELLIERLTGYLVIKLNYDLFFNK